jgi:spore coat polysaccharide biosynthesis protein SpsF
LNNETKSKVAIVQARYGSTRLKGKIFKNLSGKPMLWHVLNRLSYSKLIDKVVVATTTDSLDNNTEDFCKENKIDFYRGSIDDVLTRYYEAALEFEAGIIIRITSDCPLIDPVIVDKMLNEFVNDPNCCDYLSNVVKRTFPRGLDTEIFSFDALEKAFAEAETGSEREHVTQYIYSHPNLFTIKNYANDVDYSFYRWTVDTEEDFKLIEEIYNSLYTSGELFLFDDVLRLFEKNHSLININKNVKQKPA